MKTSHKQTDEELRSERVESARRSVFHTLLYTVFQRPRESDSIGIVVAISSVNPGEGVTHVTKELVHELARFDCNSVAGINTQFLRSLRETSVETFRESLSGATPLPRNSMAGKKVWEGVEPSNASSMRVTTGRRGPWEGSWQYRRDCIDVLRRQFDQTVIDCPSLKESGDALSIAPFVDGVILVIEANRTRGEQIRNAEQSITAADGKLLGYVLNKRKYEVPGWIYRRL